MKKVIRNKMSMYQMVYDILRDYQPVWEGTPKFVTAFDTFSAKFEALKIHAEKERAYVVGVRATRDENRRITCEKAIRIASALTALGEDHKDLELITLMRISEYQLTSRTQSDTLILLDRIILHAQEHVAELAEYGISSESIDELILRRDDLVVNILSPRKAIVKRKDSVAKIAKLSSEIDVILKNNLDRLVTVLRPSSEDLYNEYFNSRVLISYGNTGNSNPEI